MTKWVYSFAQGDAQGSGDMKALLGGKGANLNEMSLLGIPVPPGFTLTTEVCHYYYTHGKTFPKELVEQVDAALAHLEKAIGAKFGDDKNPLLVSVRSGAQASMPGMMDTVLNLGLNDQTVKGLSELTGNKRFAYDSYRRFIQMYGSVVMNVEHDLFEDVLESIKVERGITNDTQLDADDLERLSRMYQVKLIQRQNKSCPQDVREQLWGAISAVFDSWMNHRAIVYRRLNNIPDNWGTAVNIQAMVFGNMGEDSATGVAFSRNPSTGEKHCFGEYLANAQGEDVVAGIRTPNPINLIQKQNNPDLGHLPSFEETSPELYKQLISIMDVLEKHNQDMQDVEFTVQKGVLWMLQTRNGKRSGKAAFKFGVDMVKEGLTSREEIIRRLDPEAINQLLHPSIDPKASLNVLTKGLPASPGAASGHIVFNADKVEELAALGKDIILVRTETSPDDIHGMHAARGILTARGGMTSHAAVVARGMGRPCVAGASEVRIDASESFMTVGKNTFKEGEVITIDGSTGQVILGRAPTIEPELSDHFHEVMRWADDIRRLKVRVNAETQVDAKVGKDFGAEGIGLCRTEHMFFDPKRILAVREMIFATDAAGRKRALDKIMPMQRDDFIAIFDIMEGLPVTIRLLDPPLHEFLPTNDHEIQQLSEATGVSLAMVRQQIKDLEEINPMLGHRGCRLGLSYPEIYQMQAEAIFEAASHMIKNHKRAGVVEVMIPLVAMDSEFTHLKEMIDHTAQRIMLEQKVSIAYTVGTMIELPRAAIKADEIAKHAAFFSFGTNDLTQTTFGLSRDDASVIIQNYLNQGLFERDPFRTIDREGVGALVEMAVERGRKTNPHIKLGICGEHGGDPKSIEFFESVGLDYVSCSPYRVPIARLTAAQAVLSCKKKDLLKKTA